MRTVVWIALVYVVAVRLVEVGLSVRNGRRVLARGGRRVRPDGFAGIAAVHVGWILGLAVEELVLGPTPLPLALRVTCGALFLALGVLRVACVRALGDRWNVAVVVEPAPPVTSGPYRHLRHPNYALAAAELLLLPVALGLPWVGLVALPLKLLALRPRLRIEERALAEAAARSAGASGGPPPGIV